MKYKKFYTLVFCFWKNLPCLYNLHEFEWYTEFKSYLYGNKQSNNQICAWAPSLVKEIKSVFSQRRINLFLPRKNTIFHLLFTQRQCLITPAVKSWSPGEKIWVSQELWRSTSWGESLWLKWRKKLIKAGMHWI